MPELLCMQTIFHNASAAAYDILGCCLWCLVLGTPNLEARWNTNWVCREVIVHFLRTISCKGILPVYFNFLIFSLCTLGWLDAQLWCRRTSILTTRYSCAGSGTSYLCELVWRRFLGMDIWSTHALAPSIEKGSKSSLVHFLRSCLIW